MPKAPSREEILERARAMVPMLRERLDAPGVHHCDAVAQRQRLFRFVRDEDRTAGRKTSA